MSKYTVGGGYCTMTIPVRDISSNDIMN